MPRPLPSPCRRSPEATLVLTGLRTASGPVLPARRRDAPHRQPARPPGVLLLALPMGPDPTGVPERLVAALFGPGCSALAAAPATFHVEHPSSTVERHGFARIRPGSPSGWWHHNERAGCAGPAPARSTGNTHRPRGAAGPGPAQTGSPSGSRHPMRRPGAPPRSTWNTPIVHRGTARTRPGPDQEVPERLVAPQREPAAQARPRPVPRGTPIVHAERQGLAQPKPGPGAARRTQCAGPPATFHVEHPSSTAERHGLTRTRWRWSDVPAESRPATGVLDVAGPMAEDGPTWRAVCTRRAVAWPQARYGRDRHRAALGRR